MGLAFRKLSRGETDHEVIWPVVSAACLALAYVWIRLELPIPRCGFHVFTGWPCPACGATRGVVALLRGEFAEALRFNPLVLLVVASVLAFDVYAVIALCGRGRRVRLLRPRFLRPLMVRTGVIALVTMNWVYLIHRGGI